METWVNVRFANTILAFEISILLTAIVLGGLLGAFAGAVIKLRRRVAGHAPAHATVYRAIGPALTTADDAHRDRLARLPAAALRTLRYVAIFAAILHLCARIWFVYAGRFFASEDDAYRTYLAFLLAHGGDLIGRMWLPGHLVAMAAVQRLGVPVAWSGITVGTLSVIALGTAVADIARTLAPDELRPAVPWAALLVVSASPCTLVLGHSSLAEVFECALLMTSAALILRRVRGGSALVVCAAALSLLAATWVRYEAWLVAVVVPAILLLLRRRRDATVTSIAWLGPLAWLVCQRVVYDDPFAFFYQSDAISSALTGEPSTLHTIADRAYSLVTWAPVTLVGAALATWGLRHRRVVLAEAWMLAGVVTAGITLETLRGHEHAVFMPRFAYGIEVALWPLAALGIASMLLRFSIASFAHRCVVLVAALGTVAMLAAGVVRPPELIDHASVVAGLMLRRGTLEPRLGHGKLLVERVPERPPFGWAALGVLWSRWDRTVWATRRLDRWDLVQPLDVRTKTMLPFDQLPGWLDQQDVTAAWILTPTSLDLLHAAWPTATAIPIGAGALVIRDPEPPAGEQHP